MKRSVAISLSVLLCLYAIAQTPTFEWAKKLGASGRDDCNKILLDNSGNTITTGSFEGTVDFDPGPGVFNLTANTDGQLDIFIVKLDPGGNMIWAKSFGGDGSVTPSTATQDKGGNIYIAGTFTKTADFDPGPGVYTMSTSANGVSQNFFILKLDANGDFIWAKQFPLRIASITSMAIDEVGNIYSCGSFRGTGDFDPGPEIYNLTEIGFDGTYSATDDGFILKLDLNGNFTWVKQIGGALSQYAQSINLDMAGNVYVTGRFYSAIDFDPGPAEWIITAGVFGFDTFILKLTASGEFVWVKDFAENSTSSVYIQDIFLDNMGNIYAGGYFSLEIDIDPGPGVNIISAPSGRKSMFILKLTPLGEFDWVKQFDGAEITTLMMDHAENIYALGYFDNTCDFDPGPGSYNLTSSGIYGSFYILKLDNNGNFDWAMSVIDRNSREIGVSNMAVDQVNNIYIAGKFNALTDFDPGPGTYNLSPSGNSDGFILKLGQCPDINITYSANNIDTVTCSPYTLNSQTYFRTGTYVQSFKNSAGCDSILTIDLTINEKPAPDLGQDRNICFGLPITFDPGTYNTYLWQDMSSSPTFTTSTPGTYWVIVTNADNCSVSDTVILKDIVQPPSNFLKPTDSICTNRTLTLGPLKKYPAYNWSTGSSEDHITIKSTGLYWLEVTDNNGCSATDTMMVSNKECPKGINIPTAFTPNNDGKNDIFKALVFEDLKSFKLQVFDRWGNLVFETADPSRGWNGIYKGITLESSVFIWQCQYQVIGQEPEFQKGTLALIR